MTRRHRRNRRRGSYTRQYRDSARHFNARKRAGWGMNIYRNTREGKIAGVAAGLADYWDVAHWVVRLLFVVAFLFTGTLAFWAYIIAWVLLAPRGLRRHDDPVERNYQEEDDYEEEPEVEMEYDERRHKYRPRRAFRYSEPSSVRLRRARDRLDAALQRVEDMESYVTSRQYNLNKEFSKL